ncbi:MAG: DUF559 domain-containing protein [Polyangiaceae bacterium]
MELDGGITPLGGAPMRVATRALAAVGWQVLGFSNDRVTSALPRVLLRILEAIHTHG